jgi:hypothetical protein
LLNKEVKEAMSKMLNKKIIIGKHSIPLIAVLSLILVGSVLAVSYVTLQFSITTTTQLYPKVTFWQWSPSSKVNTFDYSLSLFASVNTIDENASYGIFNDDSASHQCNLCISTLSTPGNIASLRIKIYDGTNTILDKTWTQFGTLPTAWESFTTAANTKYSIWIEVTGAASPSGSSVFTLNLKENNP